MKNQVSLCMIVKNEEEYLSKCLNSIKDIVDEIIIVDTGSTDKTVEIAQKFGANVYYFKWNDNFSEARNESLKYATKDWILILDGDDELYPEDGDNLRILLNSQLDEKAVYYFETLSYFGIKVEDGNIAVNINPRLFRNNRGIYYKGEVHNQLVVIQEEYNVICESVKIHHYGYLDNTIISKDKRRRNIAILKKQIKNKTNNIGFAYFNLGNEYGALDDLDKALDCYYKSFEKFEPERGYSFILILRIIMSNYNLKNYKEALKFVDIGKEYFPKCTDLYYNEALIWKVINKPTLQIKALEKCIEIGEANSELKFIYGTGSFKAYHELGDVYMKYKDYDAAYNYYIEAISSKSDYIDPLYNIAHILKEQNVAINDFKEIIEKFFENNKETYYGIIADLFYDVGYYKIALEYIRKYENFTPAIENTAILKTRCLIRCGEFKECINSNYFNKNTSNYISHSMYKVLSSLLLKKYDYSLLILNNLEKENISDIDKKNVKVYFELVKLFKKEPNIVISTDENEKDYMNIILEILEIILINNKFQEFRIAVKLLNLIDNRRAFLNLGKLYYKHGYIELAKKQILRSIREVDIYDNEALDILKN